MGKGGAPTTTNTVQNQNVAYTPTGLQGFQDIYNRAASVASQPYQPYTGQLVEGLNPTQMGAISNISNIAANPISPAQIQQYMNPYQSDVINATMANINETNQQQMAQATGQLQQAAGGIGAERIALGQGELARQQALASNQTLAGLNQQNYAQALGAAQQQQGFGLGAAQSQLQAGTLAQQTGQAGLTAQYQQYLQQLAFPYQQAQFLAGIGLPSLGAMGGQQYQTGSANQVSTPPGLSWLQGLAGAGALGYGLYQGGAFSGLGGGSAASIPGGGNPSARGGRITGYAGGGDVPDDQDDKTFDLGPDDYHDQSDALAPVLSDKGYVPEASSPKADEKMPQPMAPIQTQTPSQGSGSNVASTLGGLASIGTAAAKVIPFLAALKTGGGVPHYDDGGGVPPGMAYPTPASLGSPLTKGALPMPSQASSPNVFYGKPLPNMLPASPVRTPQDANQNMYEMARQALQQQQLGQALGALRQHASGGSDVSVSAQEYARGGDVDQDDAPDTGLKLGALEYPYGKDSIPNLDPTDGYPAVQDLDTAKSANRKVYDRYPSPDLYIPPYDRGDYDNYAPRMNLPQETPSGNVDWRFPSDMPPAQQATGNEIIANRFPSGMTPAAYPQASGEVSRRMPDAGEGSPQGPDALKLKLALEQRAATIRAANAGPTSVPTVSVQRPPLPDETPTDISGDRPYPRPVTAPTSGSTFDPATASPRDIMNLQNYKDQVAQRPTVAGLTKNPDFWIRAGLGILAANPAKGPLGAIASGALGTVGEYDKWSKDDLTSKQKAMELAAKLKEHSDKYTQLTAHDRAQLDIEHQKLQQGKWQAFNYQDRTTGELRAGFFDTRTRQIVDSDGHPIDPGRIYGRSSKVESKDITPQQMSIIIDRYRKNHPQSTGLPDEQVRDLALQEINAQRGVPSAPARPPGMSDSQLIDEARKAVQGGKDPNQVKQQLKAWGIDTSGL